MVEVSQGIRRNVIRSVENATGLEVLEVNVNEIADKKGELWNELS